MMDIWWQFLAAGVPSVLSGILLYEYKKQAAKASARAAEREAERRALRDGVQALLRDRLLRGMEEHIANGWVPLNAMESFARMKEAYVGLKGNGVVTHLYAQFTKLPHIDPKKAG